MNEPKPYNKHWWLDFLYIAFIIGVVALGFWLSQLDVQMP